MVLQAQSQYVQTAYMKSIHTIYMLNQDAALVCFDIAASQVQAKEVPPCRDSSAAEYLWIWPCMRVGAAKQCISPSKHNPMIANTGHLCPGNL